MDAEGLARLREAAKISDTTVAVSREKLIAAGAIKPEPNPASRAAAGHILVTGPTEKPVVTLPEAELASTRGQIDVNLSHSDSPPEPEKAERPIIILESPFEEREVRLNLGEMLNVVIGGRKAKMNKKRGEMGIGHDLVISYEDGTETRTAWRFNKKERELLIFSARLFGPRLEPGDPVENEAELRKALTAGHPVVCRVKRTLDAPSEAVIYNTDGSGGYVAQVMDNRIGSPPRQTAHKPVGKKSIVDFIRVATPEDLEKYEVNL